MNKPKSHLSPLKEFAEADKLKWIDGNKLWVQQYPFDTWSHPIFNDTTIDVETANKLKQSFDRRDKGVKYFSDYEHGLDPAKGNKASGEIVELKVITEPRGAFSQAGLWGLVQFNDVAAKEIKDGEWNYWSASHYDTWTHPQTNETKELVFDGGGLTNKPWVKGMAPLNFSELGITEEQAKEVNTEEAEREPVVIVDEVVPPVIDDPKELEGGDKADMELEKKLREALGLADDADIVKAITDLNDEVTPMREALKTHNEKKAFSEAFPKEAARMEALEKAEQQREAKQFAESYVDSRLTKKSGDNDEATTLGLSGLVIQELETVAKQFSEGTPSLDGVKKVVDTILANGIVDYGTKGSTRENEETLNDDQAVPTGGMREVRKAFAEKVTKIMTDDKVEYKVALSLAADKFPKLAEAYQSAGME